MIFMFSINYFVTTHIVYYENWTNVFNLIQYKNINVIIYWQEVKTEIPKKKMYIKIKKTFSENQQKIYRNEKSKNGLNTDIWNV